MKRNPVSGCAIPFLLLLCSIARGGWVEEEHKLRMQFITPHTRWARPYAGGKVRALFFTNGRTTFPREMVELKQRFDLDVETVYYIRVVDTTRYQWHGGDEGSARITRLLDQRFDLYVFFGIPVTNLSVKQQYTLLKAVSEGAGLILMGGSDKRTFKDSNRISPLPSFLSEGTPLRSLPFANAVVQQLPDDRRTDAAALEKMISAHRLNKGRGLKLPMRPKLKYDVGWDTQYEYWQQLLGRAVLWAAGREPGMRLEVSPAKSAYDWSESQDGGPRVDVKWAGAENIKPLVFDVALRAFTGESHPLKHEQTTASEGSFSRSLPPLSAGTYFVDVRARSIAGCVTWGSCSFRVNSPRSVSSIELDAPFSEIGGRLSGKVTVEGGTAIAGERVRVRLCDWRNRVLLRSDRPVQGGSATFSFPVSGWMPMLVRVEALLMSGDSEVARTHTYFNVCKRNRGQFNFLIWDYPKETLSIYAEWSLSRLGTTLQLSGGAPPREASAFDIAWVPYTTRIMAPHDEKVHMKPCCWNDEERVNAHVQGIVDRYVTARQRGVFVYSLGDEVVTRGACVHPECIKAYRRYLEQEYGALEALNKSWGADFKSWDDVSLPSPTDNDAKEAKNKRNYPQWYDRQAFKCYNFVQLCKRFGDAYKKIDPEARTGFEGAGRLDRGDDFDLIVRTNQFWSPYPGQGDEIIRSIAPRDFPRSNWMGYSKDVNVLTAKYWRMITRGCDAVWWWRWDNVGRFIGFLSPDLGPTPQVEEMVRDTKVVRDGLGTMLIKSQMLNDGVAILYSLPSVYAASVEAGPSYGAVSRTHTAWFDIVSEQGLRCVYVTDRMLRLGEFREDKFKVLILPRSEAIGPKEAAVIRRFVKNGGVLIADVRPGVYDGHCKPLQEGCLDDVFGIERTGVPEAAKGNLAAQCELAARRIECTVAGLSADPGIKLAGAKALGKCGGAPALIVNKYGLGKAVLLNFSVADYPDASIPETPEATVDLMRALLDESKVRPVYECAGADGKPLRNYELSRWQNGKITLFSLFRQAGDDERITVRLPQPKYVYDLRRHADMGLCREFTTHLLASRATFFALMDERAPLPEAKLSLETAKRGEQVRLSVRMPGAQGLHAVRVRITAENEPAEWYNQVLMVGEDGASCTLPIAYNDRPGAWHVKVIELFTDRAVRIALQVR